MATDSQAEKCSNNSTKSEENFFRCWCGNTYAPGEKFRPHFNERDQRVRAEVLASVLRRIDLSLIEGHAAACTPAYNEALTDLRDGYLLDFQPAAQDLEELLRKAELKGLKFAEDSLHAVNPFSWANKLAGKIAELEKARALLEKS